MEFTVYTAYVVVGVLTAIANVFSATIDVVRPQRLLVSMAEVSVPESWLPTLALLKVAGALGLLVGFSVPAIGTAAAVGLVLFFVGAVLIHLRARDYSFGGQYVFLLLALATLILGLIS